MFPVPAQACLRRHAHPLAPRPSRTLLTRHRSGGALVGRAVVGRLRHRGDPARPARSAASRACGSSRRSALVIAAMLAVVVFSYRQTISRLPERRRRLHRREGEPRAAAEPGRGGVAAHRLRADRGGQHRGRRRGGHLGVPAAGTSAASRSSLGFVALLMLGNLRGVRESGRIFAVPTYFFIVSILGADRRGRVARTLTGAHRADAGGRGRRRRARRGCSRPSCC